MILFLVGLHRLVVVLLLWREGIDIAELEEAQVLTLAVHVVLNALQATEEQRLTHHVQVARQRIHDVDEGILLVAVIGRLGERVVQDLVEALAYQLLAHEIGQFVLLVLLTLDDERTLQLRGNLHIIISIDTQDILDDITGALHVNTIGRNLEGQPLLVLVLDLHLKREADGLDDLRIDILTHQVMDILETQVHDSILDGLGIDITYIHRYLTACQFLTEDGCLLQRIDGAIGIDATLEAERGIRAQTMTAGTLTDPCGMEVGAFEHDILRGLIGAATPTTEDAGDTHRLLGIADGQVAFREFMLHAVERLERCSVGHRLYDNLMPLHHVGIEGMQRLAIGHHDIVRDVYDVIDGAQANGGKSVLQPVRALFHLAVGDADTGIALASLLILDGYLDRQIVIIDLELRAVRAVHLRLVAIALQPGIQVAGHSPVREAVSTVGGDVHLNEPVALQMIVLSGRRAYHGILREDDDAGMVIADTDLILCTDHTVRLDATQLGLLDDKLLVAIIEHTTQVGHDHLLTRSHIGGATDNL